MTVKFSLRWIVFSLLLILGRSALAQAPIHTHHETIPNPVVTATIASVQSGDWSSLSTWSAGNRIPGPGDRVAISPNTIVTYNIASDAIIRALAVRPSGVLKFKEDINTRLTLVDLLVEEGGKLTVGTVQSPVLEGAKAEIVIADQATDPVDDPNQWWTGMNVLGELEMVGSPRKPYERLSTEALQNQNQIVLSAPANDWRVGDRVKLPDSTHHWRIEPYQPRGSFNLRIEERTITGISPDKKTFTLDSSLSNDHPGARDKDGVIRFLPHALNLTRNVEVRSANPSGFRGHVAIVYRGVALVRYAAFIGLGRTLNQLAGSGTGNPKGRYAFHTHHAFLGGEFYGNVVDGIVNNANGARSGIWIHGSHYWNVLWNIATRTAGWAIGMEDGGESNNTFANNFALDVLGSTGRQDGPIDNLGEATAGAGLWIKAGFNNVVRDNIVANAAVGYNLFFGRARGNTYPKARGLDPHDAGNFLVIDPQGIDFTMTNTEVYSTYEMGEHWEVSHNCKIDGRVSRTTIDGLKAWHIPDLGLQYPATNMLMKNFTVINNPAIWDSTGYTLGDYGHRNFKGENWEVQGMNWAFGFSSDSGGGVQKIINSKFYNNRSSIDIPPTYTSGSAAGMPPVRYEIDNVEFISPANSQSSHLSTGNSFTWSIANTQRSDIMLRNAKLDGNLLTSSIYRPAQHTNFLVPPHIPGSSLNSPTLGLLNSELFSQFGLAMGGEVAPCSIMMKGVTGMLCNAPQSKQLIGLIDWFKEFRPAGPGQFEIFLHATTNVPTTLNATVLGQTITNTAANGIHVVRLGVFPSGVYDSRFPISFSAPGFPNYSPISEATSIYTPAAGDTTPPVLSDPDYLLMTAIATTPTSQLIGFRINELTLVTVEYGTTAALGTIGYQSQAFEKVSYSFGSAELKNLTPNTDYFVKVTFRDAAGNALVKNATFKTPPTPSGTLLTAVNRSVQTNENFCVGGTLSASGGTPAGYRLFNLPSNGAVSIAQNGTFNYIPMPDSAGVDSFQYVAIDSFGRRSTPATVTVNVNGTSSQPPVINPVANLSINQGGQISQQIQATDPQGLALQYSVVSSLPLIIDGSGRLTGSIASNQTPGFYSATVEVTNTNQQRSGITFGITVIGTQQPPVTPPPVVNPPPGGNPPGSNPPMPPQFPATNQNVVSLTPIKNAPSDIDNDGRSDLILISPNPTGAQIMFALSKSSIGSGPYKSFSLKGNGFGVNTLGNRKGSGIEIVKNKKNKSFAWSMAKVTISRKGKIKVKTSSLVSKFGNPNTDTPILGCKRAHKAAAAVFRNGEFSMYLSRKKTLNLAVKGPPSCINNGSSQSDLAYFTPEGKFEVVTLSGQLVTTVAFPNVESLQTESISGSIFHQSGTALTGLFSVGGNSLPYIRLFLLANGAIEEVMIPNIIGNNLSAYTGEDSTDRWLAIANGLGAAGIGNPVVIRGSEITSALTGN